MLLLKFRPLLNLLLHPILWGAAMLALALTSQAQTQLLAKELGKSKVSNTVQTPQVTATLWVDAPQGISAGQTIWLGLQLTHQAHWHTYWRNPGDSGLPTELTWKLPSGLTTGPLIWPVPKKIPIGTLANFGYEDKVLLVTPVKVDPTFKPAGSSVDIQLRANWLVCKQECIPQEGDFQLTVPVNGATVMAPADFQKALQYQAKLLKGAHEASIANDGRTLQLTLASFPTELQKGDWTLFPQTGNVLQNNAPPLVESDPTDANGARTIKVRISGERMDSPKQMSWLLVQGKADAPTGLQWTFDTPVQGQWREFAEDLQAADSLKLTAPSMRNTLAAPLATWALALLGAFAGGLLLNLMPCVFPVLAIKLLSITQHSQSKQHMNASAWAFTVGVLLSFLLLGGLMLAFRAAGSQLGWGFQLQSPWVVGGLALLFAVMGLNLSGMFEFGAFVPSSVAGVQWSRPWVNALWSGVFAVVIASPCTAPFMGASLGLAIGLPAWQALPIFGAMGLGMALPFMALTVSTAWVQLLPRPGAWMITFRQFMAFPMYATVIWLVWVLGQQVGLEGVSGFLICLLSLAMVLWALPKPGKVGWGLRGLTVLLLALSFGYWGPSWTHIASETASDSVALEAGKTAQGTARAVAWEVWSEEKVAKAREAGRPVFIDFTAAWCVTCQFNKRATFSQPEVLSAFAQKNVLLLRADWTRYDPTITQALNAMGRNGVPVYAWYAPGQAVQLLSELPSVTEIQSALRQVSVSP